MLPERRRSALAKADDALLVVGGIVVALLALRLLGWIVGAVFFAVKLAIVALVVMAVVRLVASRRR